MDRNRSPRGLAAHFALPVGFTALLLTGALAAGLGGRLPATGVLILAAAVVLAISVVAEPLVAPVLGVIGWLTVVGFSHPPYAQLRMTGPVALRAAVTMAICVLAGAGIGLMVRALASSFRLGIVHVRGGRPESGDAGRSGITGPAGGTMRAGLKGRRQAVGILLVAGLPLLTMALVALRPHLDLANDLLVYLVAVVAVAIVGGFWAAVLAAITASLLLNWYFTRPLHTLTIVALSWRWWRAALVALVVASWSAWWRVVAWWSSLAVGVGGVVVASWWRGVVAGGVVGGLVGVGGVGGVGGALVAW